MAIDRRPLEYIRDCVKKAFENGVERGREFQKMRHALIVELKYLKYTPDEVKDLSVEWNERCEKMLPPSEMKRQLFNYVDWVFRKDTRLGCRALNDYCIGENICQYRLRTAGANRAKTAELPFDMRELEQYLEERFKSGGHPIILIVKALRYYQQEKATGDIILIGARTISQIIRGKYGHTIDHMTVWRQMQLLIDEGIIEQAIKGKSGTFKHLANGYRFLRWWPPISTHINSMCNTNAKANQKDDTQ